VIDRATRSMARPGARLLMCSYCVSFLLVPARMLTTQGAEGAWGKVAEHLKTQLPAGAKGNMAGCGGWNDNVQIAWLLGLPDYGVTGATAGEVEMREFLNPEAKGTPAPEQDSPDVTAQKLADYKVKYFLALPACPSIPPTVLQHPVAAEWEGAKIYQLDR
jgi:hypothetical protein